MGVFRCVEKRCKLKNLLAVNFVDGRCSWCGHESEFVSDNVPETATKDGAFWVPEGEKDGKVC
jgi:hypothetical protein